MNEIARFREYEMDFSGREELARKYAESLDDDYLERADVPVLATQIVDMHAAIPVSILVDKLSHEVRWPKSSFAEIPAERTIRVNLSAPCTGAAGSLGYYARGSGVAPSGKSDPTTPNIWQVILGIDLALREGLTADVLGQEIVTLKEKWMVGLQDAADKANADIAAHRARTLAQVTEILDTKQRLLNLVRTTMRTVGIGLKPSARSLTPIPMRPVALTLAQVNNSVDDGVPEYELAEDIALALLDTIRSFTAALERLPESANALLAGNEQSMRDILLFILNANWEGTATGETFIGLGKSDILLRWRNKDAFTGECKIWSSERDLSKAVDQLLDRYMVWRNTRGALIVFIRDRQDTSAIVEKAKSALTLHENFLSTVHNSRFPKDLDYKMRSSTDPDRAITLSLITVPLPDMRAAVKRS